MTEDQLAYFTEQTLRANKHVLRLYMRRALIGFLVLLAGVSFAAHNTQTEAANARDAILESARIVVVDGCNRDFIDRLQVRGVLEDSSKDIRRRYNEGAMPREEAIRRLKFYKHELSTLPLPDCRRAPDILTDNPDEINGTRVDPLYPGHPRAEDHR